MDSLNRLPTSQKKPSVSLQHRIKVKYIKTWESSALHPRHSHSFFSCKAICWLIRNCLYLPPPFRHSITFFEGYTERVPWGSRIRNHAWLTYEQNSQNGEIQKLVGRNPSLCLIHCLFLRHTEWNNWNRRLTFQGKYLSMALLFECYISDSTAFFP